MIVLVVISVTPLKKTKINTAQNKVTTKKSNRKKSFNEIYTKQFLSMGAKGQFLQIYSSII